MLSCCFKESKNPRVTKKINKENCFYQNVQCVIVKNQDLSKDSEQVIY